MIRFELDAREARVALERLGRSIRDPKPALGQIGEALTQSTKQRFGAGVAPDGRAWAPNTPATVERYLRGYFGGAPPRKKRGGPTKRTAARAAGKRPLIGESQRLRKEIAYQVGGRHVEVGSSLVYSATQQFGARRGQFGGGARPVPWGDIPARPFLGVSAQDSDLVAGIITRYLSSQV